ncbi:MAG TPA: histidine kinase [Prolixibacteraceae bacterium]|nr:histidine kinase [Prolixibacteraceae bacterium]
MICLTIHFPLVLSALFEEGNRQPGHHRGSFNIALALLELFSTFLIALFLFLLNYFIIKPFDRNSKLSWKVVLLSLFLTLASVVLIVLVFEWIKSGLELEVRTRRHEDEYLFRSFFGSALVLGCMFIIRLIFQKQTFELENEMLRSEGLQSRFESLKNQVSPHFLFNSLTALKALIPESPALADKYVDHLSGVLRYTLQSNEKMMVTLQEELESTGSYIYLIGMRYDKNLTININIDDRFLNFRLPPLTLQTLLENAVKHNEISSKNPLTIEIRTTSDAQLEIVNPMQLKQSPEEGTGIGLTNLSRQYQLLGGKDISIKQENGNFSVTAPLMEGQSYESAGY